MRTLCASVLLSAILGLSPVAIGETLLVHPDGSGAFPTIQAAVDAATAGDVVELSGGTYRGSGNRDVQCYGKAISIRSSSNDPDQCIIDCESDCSAKRRGFEFRNLASGRVLLQGVTIINGCSDYGGAVFCFAPARFVQCVFRGNRNTSSVDFASGGAVCAAAVATFEECLFEQNEAKFGGALMGIAGAGLTFTRCVFKENTAAPDGGACYFTEGPTVRFDDCLFVGNTASTASTICAFWNSSVILEHCTVMDNVGVGLVAVEEMDAHVEISHSIFAFNQGYPIACDPGVTIACSDIFGNEGGDWVGCLADQLGQDGNVCLDPQFCSLDPSEDENWSIQSDSPCAAGQSGCGLMGAWSVGCGTVDAEERTWGGVKLLFRK
jgi:hypothetical protein